MLALCYCVGTHYVPITVAFTNSPGDCHRLYLEKESCNAFHGFVYKSYRDTLEGFQCLLSRVALVITIRGYL